MATQAQPQQQLHQAILHTSRTRATLTAFRHTHRILLTCPPPHTHCCPPLLQINQRIIPKRIHVRVEHVQPSRCREDFMKRRASNDAKKHEANMKGGEYTLVFLGCFWSLCVFSFVS